MNNEVALHHAASDCANCGATVSGHFCHACGQETVLHPPSAREFMHEFIGHYVALEGKLWKSLGLLLFRPGQLTLEYIKGRRVRYVQPLRMYLTFSLIFFAVMKYTGHGELHVAGPDRPTAAAHRSAAAAPDKPGETGGNVGVIHEDRPGEFREGTRWLRDRIAPRSPVLAGKLEHFADMSQEEREKGLKTAFYAYAPYAIFFMMPLFALYLKILYLGSGQRYGEHLLFALHSNGFAFLAMTLLLFVDGFDLIEFLLGLWLVFYLPTAMRRVYGGSRKLTALRWIVLMLLHMITIGTAIFMVVAYGVLH